MDQNDISSEIKMFNYLTDKNLDYIIEKNIPFSYRLTSSDFSVQNFKKAIIYLSLKNYDFKSKQIVIYLDSRGAYLNRNQIVELQKCDGIINVEGGSLVINDENDNLWNVNNIIIANNKIDNGVELINSLRVPDEDNRPLNKLEKVLMAYEICRSLVYNDNPDNKMNARTITAILNDGRDIVCVGYSKLFQELCKRLGVECYRHYCSVGNSASQSKEIDHVNNVIVINKKVFYNDVCWDSVKPGDRFAKYNFFMLPYSDKTQIKDMQITTDGNCGDMVSPFVDIDNDKKNLKSALTLKESLSPQLKETLTEIGLKYSDVVKLDYFDQDSSDTEIKQICKQLLDELNEYQLDYSIPIETLEKSLYNLNRSCGMKKEDAENAVKSIITYNIHNAGAWFNQGAINCFNEAYMLKQNADCQV